MKINCFVICTFLLWSAGAICSESGSASGPGDQTYAAQWQAPVLIQGEQLPWPHEVRVSLPPTYKLNASANFPVLWLTDGALYFGAASEMASLYATLGHMPHIIIVSIGHPRDESRTLFQQKRSRDFIFSDYQPFDLTDSKDPALLKHLKANPSGSLSEERRTYLHGAQFLDFIVDELRPQLAQNYRFANDHILFGHSGGSMFVARSLFQRPGAFDRYIMSSGLSYDAFKASADYAAAHNDLPARLFIAAGDSETEYSSRASQRLVSNTMRFAEDLVLGEFPSLDLEVRLYRDQNHATVPFITLSEGLIWSFSDLVQ